MRTHAHTSTIILAFLLCIRVATVLAQGSAELTSDHVAERYEAQWRDVHALRFEFRRETRTRTATNSFNRCSWEMIEGKGKAVESRVISFPSDPSRPDSSPITAKVITERYFDGEKLYEITEPIDEWPLASAELSDYEKLRRRGVRATISNRNSRGLFLASCPIPRYFSVPTEKELLTLTELVKKYDSKIIKRVQNDRGEELVQMEIRNDAVAGSLSEAIRAWALYISLNIDKNYAVAGYQYSVTLNRQPPEKVFTEYTADEFQELTPSGVWVPMKAEVREHTGGLRSSLTRIALRSDSIHINDPSDNLGEFHFLPGMVVREVIFPEDSDAIRPKIRVHIWGDDSPTQTFESEKAFREFFIDKFGAEVFNEEIDRRLKIMGRRRMAMFFAVACFCLLAFLGLVLRTYRAIERDREFEEETESAS